MPTRTYPLSDGSAIEWRHELCSHCGNCTRGLPQVFDVNKKPWVDVTKASPEEIKKQAMGCPSGALSVKDK